MTDYLKMYLPLCITDLVLDYAKNAIIIFDNDKSYLFDGIKLQLLNFEPEKVLVCYIKNKLFKFVNKKWVNFEEVNLLITTSKDFYNHAFAVTDSFLYFSGGVDSNFNYLKTVYKFNLKNNRSIQFPPMNTVRVDHSLTVLNNKLYAIGGSDGMGLQLTVEYFNGTKWIFCKSLNNQRYRHKSIAHKGKIYVFGGQDNDDDNLSVERYDPEKNIWIITTYMPTFRTKFQIISLDDNIYIVSENNIDIYNTELDKWTNFNKKDFFPSCLTVL